MGVSIISIRTGAYRRRTRSGLVRTDKQKICHVARALGWHRKNRFVMMGRITFGGLLG